MLIPIYFGSIDPDAVFDPSLLSGIVVQVKFKIEGATKAESDAIRPLGVNRDLSNPLPYLALLMELGNEQTYQKTNSKNRKMKSTPSEPLADGKFRNLTQNWARDLDRFQTSKGQAVKPTKAETQELQNAVQKSRQAMDFYNRYFISVRGASDDVYGILKEAKIEKEFETFLSVTMPAPTDQDDTMEYMRPLESLRDHSRHTAWMLEYSTNQVDDEDMSVDE